MSCSAHGMPLAVCRQHCTLHQQYAAGHVRGLLLHSAQQSPLIAASTLGHLGGSRGRLLNLQLPSALPSCMQIDLLQLLQRPQPMANF